MTMSMTVRQMVSPTAHVPMKTRNGAIAKYLEESFQLAAPLSPDEVLPVPEEVLPDGVGVGRELELELELELDLELELEMGRLMPFESSEFESSELELESLFKSPSLPPDVLVGRGLVEVTVGMGTVEVLVRVSVFVE